MAYLDERFDVLARLRRQAGGRSFADVLRLDGRALRFHVGTSLADLRVPVYVSPTLEDTFRAAVRDLFFLLSIRHRSALKETEYERLLLLDGFDPRMARTVSFGAPSSVRSDGIRRAFLEAAELNPALDSGVVASWISKGRPGRVLVGVINALLRRAAEEGAQNDRAEPTPYIVLLALRSLAHLTHEAVKDLPVGGVMGRTLAGAVSTGIVVALRMALRESGVLSSQSAVLCEAAAVAVPWLSRLRQFWASGSTLYGPAIAEPMPHLEQYVQKILSGATIESIARDASMQLVASKELQKKAVRAVALTRMRADVLQLLRMAEAGRAPWLSLDGVTLAQLFQMPGLLERTLTSTDARKDLGARAKANAKAATNEPARTLLESIAAQTKEWSDEDPGSAVSMETVMKSWAVTTAAIAVDTALDRALDQTELQLVHRTGAENEGGIDTQYQGGKLYLLGVDERPVLMQRTRAPQMGHLFCDMKDFTKRTAFLKETVVADFLSREFYGPILTAAARYAHGAAHLADKGGIYLNNLLGDAVSFSGDIVSLVELTHDIRKALASYARRLDNEGNSAQIARTIASIEEKFRGQAQDLEAQLRSAQEALRRGVLDPLSGDEPSHRIAELRVEKQKLDDEREAEIALATGEKLEAGIFISYGAAPEVATFEDHLFGHIKVSIAEKINESARGTARNANVRARLDAQLAQERTRLRRPELIWPFSVAVAQSLSMPIHGATEMALRASIAAGDLDGAETMMGNAVRDFLTRLAAQSHAPDRGDIYNGGAALSEEALAAYVEARGDELVIVRREVPVTELNAALRERFVFPSPSLRLVMAISPTVDALEELYVYAGRALFKGFEKQGGLGVYEMVSRDNPFFMLLAQHHVPAWLREHDDSDSLLTPLRTGSEE